MGETLAEAVEAIKRLLGLWPGEAELNRVKRRGAGATQFFTLSTARSVAAKYGIDISGLDISLGKGSDGDLR